MKLLIALSFRNLMRQKRRNLFLGTAIAIGMSVLVVANAFSHGISDVIFNRLLAYMSGNISVSFTREGNRTRQLFPEGEIMLAITRKTLPDLASMEEAIGLFSRAIGNHRTDNVILVGMDAGRTGDPDSRAEIQENFRMIEGRFEDLRRTDLENPVILASEKARSLNVRLHDLIRVRYQDVHGQNQAARLTVAGIFKPSNVFMTAPVFLDIRNLRVLAGYGPHDLGQIYLMLKDPKKNAVRDADLLHARLVPKTAIVHGDLSSRSHVVSVRVLGFRVDSASLAGLAPYLGALTKNDVVFSRDVADSLSWVAGDPVVLRYASRLDSLGGSDTTSAVPLKVTRFVAASAAFPSGTVLVNDKDFYGFFYDRWPLSRSWSRDDSSLAVSGPIARLLCPEWLLLDRTRTTQALQKKYRDLPTLKTHAVAVDVQTMYETASMIVNLEYALNLITLAAVLVLFFIIQVGVVNTLRMTIRERTREIGTLRAIGMQKKDVRTLFLLESFFMAVFSCIAGVLLAFAAMAGFSQWRFNETGNHFDMLLVDGHLHFKPSLVGTLLYFALILAIAVITAWFPARRAARLSPTEALRHFE
jgi:ABC-type lipoprotein release transport system permease subunit